MNILIVYAHPSKKGYTYRVLQDIVEQMDGSGHAVRISDLYAMDFRAEMNETEYLRESQVKTSLPVSADIKAEQDKIEWSDAMIFLYPVWWSDCPAIMKGWFDRVFSIGYAYDYDPDGRHIVKMKKIKHGLVICTAGADNEQLEVEGIADSMRKIMLNDRLGSRFENKSMIILGGTLTLNDVRSTHRELITSIPNILLID